MNPALIKPPLFLACLAPLAYYAWGVQADTLGANPIETVTRGLGTWALNFLLITLTVTPLRKYSGWAWLGRLRRMLGLFVFFYAVLHLGTYLWFDQFFDWPAIARDILKRPFITVGMISFALLVPLAVTSNAYAIRKLGGRRWQELHRSVYAIGLLAVLHYSWMVKADLSKPLVYALLVGILLGLRVWWRVQERNRQLAGAYPAKPLGRIIPLILKK
ncbi:MAG: protein-methionine-sulfoxide reductase heme-binding subunit MsrQ [Sulfuritalea sp.]|nr:protein-methionine-sulfoxide reductase heme-binding subunit MsrQ [Sulfuritalea sp.]